MELAASSNPGIPPASLMVFLSVKPSVEGVVIAEHNDHYINPFFDSLLDDKSNVDASSIAATAALFAKTIHQLSGRGSSFKVHGQGNAYES